MAKKKTKAAPRPVAKRSTAVAKRAPAKRALLPPDVQPAAPADVPPDVLPERALDDNIMLGDYGLAEVKFTVDEERVLDEPVRFEDVRVLPDNGALYLSHPAYTKWLNRAFGRMGWTLRPAAKPLLGDGSVIVPYLLFVHGKPVAFVYGEQEYHPSNKRQTYGDALEATRASGLRRCCKQLGMALELWDKPFVQAFMEDHVLRVKVVDKGEVAYWYRRKIDPPFWQEDAALRPRREPAPRSAPRTQEPAMRHGREDEVITEKQRGRLWGIARRVQREEEELKAYLKIKYGIDSTKEIKRRDYEDICAAVEHPGPLDPTAGVIDVDREAGEEG